MDLPLSLIVICIYPQHDTKHVSMVVGFSYKLVKMSSKNDVHWLLVWHFIASLLFLQCSSQVPGQPQVPAMFVFGDSLIDVGNNNYLSSIAKANYYPYGIDFFQGPTGRFCNGKTVIDVLCKSVFVLPYHTHLLPSIIQYQYF